MNTRTYHRNSNLAFPKTADYGCAIERKRPADRAVTWKLAISILAIILVIAFQGAPI